MENRSIRQKPSEALSLYVTKEGRDLVTQSIALGRELRRMPNRATYIARLANTDDAQFITAAFLGASVEQRLAIADNEHTPAEILADLYNDLVLIVAEDDQTEDGLKVISLRSPHPQRAKLHTLLTLNPNTPLEVLTALVGRKLTAQSMVSVALGTYYAHAGVQTQLTVASHPRTPQSTLSLLTSVRDPQVRVALAYNPNTPIVDALTFLNDDRETPCGKSPTEAVRDQEARIRAEVAAVTPEWADLPLETLAIKLRLGAPSEVVAAAEAHYDRTQLTNPFTEEGTA